jgi:hypothetical protein
MSELAGEMVEAVARYTVDSLPDELLAVYRNPPGRKPHQHTLRVQSALAGIDDTIALELLRDVADTVVFHLFYLIDSQFENRGISTIITRDSSSYNLDGSLLHELYRSKVDPGGARSIE